MGEPVGQCTRVSGGASARSRTSRLMPYTWNWMSAMGSSAGEVGSILPQLRRAPGGAAPGSPAEPRQGRLLPRRLDPLELALDPVEGGGGVVVLVPGIGQVLADDVEGV